MSSAGRSSTSGMSDTGRTNLPGDQGNPTGAGGPLMPGEDMPEEQIEVVEIIGVEDDTGGTEPGAFRWWYVPAIGLPIGIGAGATVWYLTKGKEPYQNAWELVTRPTRNLMGPSTTKKAARKARAKSNTLRDRVAGSLSSFDAAELAEKAGDLWDDARDSMVDLWDQITVRDATKQARGITKDARAKTQRQIGKMVGSIAAAGAALAIQQKASNLADAARMQAQAARGSVQSTTQRVTARTAASKNAMKAAKARSARAAKQTRKRVTSPIRRVGVFALAALATAMVIYVRSWYSRRGGTAGELDTGDMRETASGRMEPDTWPRFEGRASDAAAPSATRSPTEPS